MAYACGKRVDDASPPHPASVRAWIAVSAVRTATPAHLTYPDA
ncbi:MAG: hypothetical protein JWP07_731 [Pseudonocardiales bacterium]|nr:hypothetical protein [Pseudonocardiales bacterium]